MDIETLLPKPKREESEREERKGLGLLLAPLTTSLGGNGAFFYGLLASKGGIIAIILTGSTVAAGIGVVGSQLGFFSSSKREPEPGSVFEQAAANSKPRTPKSILRAGRNGVSESLEYLVRANRRSGVSRAGARAPERSETSSRQAGGGPLEENSNPPSGFDTASAPQRVGRPIGQMTTQVDSGGPRPALKSQSGLANGIGKSFQPVFRAAAPQAAASGPSAAGGGGGVPGGRKSTLGVGRLGLRGIGGGNKAADQLASTNRAVQTNLHSTQTSSAASGVTYDGASVKNMTALHLNSIVGGGLSNGGAGFGGSGAAESAFSSSKDIVPPAPPVPGAAGNKTPWQWAINVAMASMALATLAFMAMSYFKSKGLLPLAQMAASVATAAGGMATSMGMVLMTTYKQQLQGAEWAAIGGITTALAAHNLAKLMSSDPVEYKKATGQQGQQSFQQSNSLLQTPNMPPPLSNSPSGQAPQAPQPQPGEPKGLQRQNLGGDDGVDPPADSAPEPQPGVDGGVKDPTQVDPTDPNTIVTPQG